MAFGIPVFVFGLIWLLGIPKNAKTMFWAKVFRQDVFIGASDSGKLPFYRGHTEGPGVFRSHDGVRIDFIPRGSEAWINKTFHADKIGYLIGYVGKAISGSFETIAVLRAHEILQEHKNKIKKRLDVLRKKHPGITDVEVMDAVFRDFLNNNPEGKKLMEGLKQAQANVVKKEREKLKAVEGEKTRWRVKKTVERLVAILLDPRIIQSYFTNTVQPSQARHVHDVGYRQGYRDGSNPAAKFKSVLIIIIIGAAVAGVIALLLLMGGNGA